MSNRDGSLLKLNKTDEWSLGRLKKKKDGGSQKAEKRMDQTDPMSKDGPRVEKLNKNRLDPDWRGTEKKDGWSQKAENRWIQNGSMSKRITLKLNKQMNALLRRRLKKRMDQTRRWQNRWIKNRSISDGWSQKVENRWIKTVEIRYLENWDGWSQRLKQDGSKRSAVKTDGSFWN
jgi:hypothetical protein